MTGRNAMLRFGALLFALAVLASWQLAAAAHIVSPVFFPEPTRALAALWQLYRDGTLLSSIADTCLRMFFGWVLASLLGVALGAALARLAWARTYIAPSLEFLRPLPASAIIPPAILFLGLGDEMSVTVIAFGAIWPVLLGAYHGFGQVEPRLAEVAAFHGIGPWAFAAKIALPSALPDIFAGLRVSLAVALILAVVTEMQAGLPGLGFTILMAQRTFRSPDLYAGILVLGAVGYVTNHALVAAERRLLRWRSLSR